MLSLYREPAERPLHLFAFQVLGPFWPADGVRNGSWTELVRWSPPRCPAWRRVKSSATLSVLLSTPLARTEDVAFTPRQVRGTRGL